MGFYERIKGALKILFKGEMQEAVRSPIPSITEDEVREIQQFFSRPKFFILGHARSGTTLLTRLIRLHPEIHCNYQAHFFTRPPTIKSIVDSQDIETWLSHPANRWNQGRDLSPLVLRAAADFILERDAAREGKRIVGDKSPSYTIHGQAVRDMHAVYPDARVIYIVRDGRDVLTSLRIRQFIEEKANLTPEDRSIVQDLLDNPIPFKEGRRSIFTETFIRQRGTFWKDDLTEIPREGQRLYGSRFHSLRYEELLADPIRLMMAMYQFLQASDEPSLHTSIREVLAENPDIQWQAQRNLELFNFRPKGQVGNWQAVFSDRDKTVFKDTAGDQLVAWGYEDDHNW